MSSINRRHFLATGLAGAAGLMTASASAGVGSRPTRTASASTRLDRPISFQSYGMRHQIEEDFIGTLTQVKALGYDGVEMCYPRGTYYRTAGYGNLTDLAPEEVKRQIEDAGLFCRTSHFEANAVLSDSLNETIEYAAAMGLQDIVMSGSTFGEDGTADEIKEWGEQCNKAAETVQAAGLRLGYHNHQVGPMVDDRPQYEHIMDALDPELVVMQFQFASISGGFDLEYYLEKYAGRYASLHMHDYDPARKNPRRPGRLGGIVPLGEGMIDWAAVLRAAMKSDISDHGFIVEIETAEPLEGLRRSAAYLETVTV